MIFQGVQVVPGLLSVRQVTGVLQQHAACSKSPDSTLQYPQMLEVLCECAVLLRQQIQRKLAGPWVNLTEVSCRTLVNTSQMIWAFAWVGGRSQNCQVDMHLSLSVYGQMWTCVQAKVGPEHQG